MSLLDVNDDIEKITDDRLKSLGFKKLESDNIYHIDISLEDSWCRVDKVMFLYFDLHELKCTIIKYNEVNKEYQIADIHDMFELISWLDRIYDYIVKNYDKFATIDDIYKYISNCEWRESY